MSIRTEIEQSCCVFLVDGSSSALSVILETVAIPVKSLIPAPNGTCVITSRIEYKLRSNIW